MTADAPRPANALACSDIGDTACGVGNSVSALLSAVPGLDPQLVDPAAPWPIFADEARRAAARSDEIVAVYPTRSMSRRPAALARLAALRWWFRHGRVSLYLHEFGRLGRKHRTGVLLALALVNGRVVVCVPSEVDAVRRAGGGIVARRNEVVAVPAVNGSPASAEAVEEALHTARARPEHRRRTVGVFGTYRPDKGPEWLDEALVRLDRRFDRLELAGSGWDRREFVPAIRSRYEIEHLGHVATADLPGTFGRWGLALAPFWEGGAHDGRTSLRTTLAFGVTTLTRAPRPGDLSLDVPHLLFDDPATMASVPDLDVEDRRIAAEAVASHEADIIRRAAAALFDVGS